MKDLCKCFMMHDMNHNAAMAMGKFYNVIDVKQIFLLDLVDNVFLEIMSD
jgi:hypothetical protein